MSKKDKTILVSAKPAYVHEQSDPVALKFVWSYEIMIENHTPEIVQLLSRHWKITDASGHIEDVKGMGVIGLQPMIKPGARFIYTSFCQLMTPQGTMEGVYVMQDLNERHFEVEIPKFILCAPSNITRVFRSKLH